jgi:hypothetical protein
MIFQIKRMNLPISVFITIKIIHILQHHPRKFTPLSIQYTNRSMRLKLSGVIDKVQPRSCCQILLKKAEIGPKILRCQLRSNVVGEAIATLLLRIIAAAKTCRKFDNLSAKSKSRTTLTGSNLLLQLNQ